MRTLIIGLLAAAMPVAGTAAPISSPDVVAKPTPAAHQAPIDPERLTLAREVVLAFVPPGSMQKVLGALSESRTQMMAQMYHISPNDLGAKGAKDGDKTLGDIMRERDPHFQERMEITNRVMMEEMGKIMVGFEPELREVMARMYARRFTKAELTDLATFLRTPSGKSFASQMFSMMSDPEYQDAMKALAPKIIQAMPGIFAKIKKATAHLPPPPGDDQKATPAELPST